MRGYKPAESLIGKVSKNVYLRLIFFTLTFCAALSSLAQGAYKPTESTGSLSEYINERCKVVYKGRLINKLDFEVLAPENIQFDGKAVAEAYNRVIATIDRFSRDAYSPHNIRTRANSFRTPVVRAVLLISPYVEKRVSLRSYSADEGDNRAFAHYDMIFINTEWLADPTPKIICHITTMAAKAMWQDMGTVKLKTGRWQTSGWYDLGMAEYISFLSSAPPCVIEGRAKECLALFRKEEERKLLWDFCPGCLDNETFLSGAKKADLSKGQRTALGAFLFMEKALGEKKLQELVRGLNKRGYWQDDSFYKKLKESLGFDIRAMKESDLQRVLGLDETLPKADAPAEAPAVAAP